jgi:predicted MPP superfamily phosphohydrolase
MNKTKGKRKKIIILAVLLIVAVWTIWGNVTVGISRYQVSSTRLPSGFDGFRIAVISDLHNASFGKDNRQIIEKVREISPDIIALTGDLVDANKTDIEVAINLVSELMAIAPCYYVTGNHEAWITGQYALLEEGLLKEGVRVLHDEVVLLTENGQSIQLAGVDDPDFTDRSDYIQESILETKLQQMNLTSDYCVLLSHRPELFEAYVKENVDLVLSGHAHGGQFRLPFIGGIIAPNQGFFPKYDGGVYQEQNTVMIVSRGIGNSVIPIRFNNRPEIVVVELKSE